MAGKKTIYRDSGTGRIISPDKAKTKNPNTWEKERVVDKPRGPSKPSGGKKK